MYKFKDKKQNKILQKYYKNKGNMTNITIKLQVRYIY